MDWEAQKCDTVYLVIPFGTCGDGNVLLDISRNVQAYVSNCPPIASADCSSGTETHSSRTLCRSCSSSSPKLLPPPPKRSQTRTLTGDARSSRHSWHVRRTSPSCSTRRATAESAPFSGNTMQNERNSSSFFRLELLLSEGLSGLPLDH